ncbi:MAG TPA: hypothetical protein VFS08_04020 [Gemmatimonadaceae bacterium]|nr:hypothetical protein [Gemmatimonadaceae bacterium]
MPISHPHRFGRPAVLLGAAALVLAAACGTPEAPTAPPLHPSLSLASTDTTPGRRLLRCPLTTSQSAERTLSLLGGTISLGGNRVVLPFGAITLPQLFEVKTVSGDLMAVDVHAVGLLGFRFQQPVTVTIDYSRCGSVQGPLRVWYIDPETHALLEDMGGVTDTLLRTITFQTTHLSVYAVAN